MKYTLYIGDECTTPLIYGDVKRLISALNKMYGEVTLHHIGGMEWEVKVGDSVVGLVLLDDKEDKDAVS